MATLYCLGQKKSLLVCGTTNRAEMAMGYLHKHADSGVDVLPWAIFSRVRSTR